MGEAGKTRVFLAVLLASAGAPALAAGGLRATPAAVPAGAQDILTGDSYWRWHVTFRRPMVEEDGKLTLLKRVYFSYRHWGDNLESPPPPEYWMKPDFDDSDWPRSRAKWFRLLAFGRYSSAAACLRGKFSVPNPAAVRGLYLSLKYRGGAVVYLNGREVCRAHLPKGKLTPETAAEAYPAEAFVEAGGKPIPGERNRRKLPADEKKRLETRVAKRERSLGPIKLPGRLLRRGVNLLAVEVRRSNYHASAHKWFTSAGAKKVPWWMTIGLSEIRLQALGGGAVPNTSRPQGMQLWSVDRHDRVCILDYGAPDEKLRPVKMVGARNGTFCGQVVLGSTGAIGGVKVAPRELKAAKGSIPAKNVEVLFGLSRTRYYGKTPWFTELTPAPPQRVEPDERTKGALLPVFFRVRVPKDAAPGEYKGSISVSASGRTFKVPVELSVADWTVPDQRDYRTYIGIYQSPTSVALQYKVEPWSEKHWKLLEKSFALLARVGNKMVNIPVVDETQFGNPEGMIRWVKKPDGSYDYDFTTFDRYMKLVVKHCGKQDYVCLQVWHAGGWSFRPVDVKCTVQVLDEKTGKREPVQVPLWGKPEAAEFWKPFLAQAQARLAKMGMPKAMTVGILSCSTAPNEVFKTLSEAFPGGQARWHRGCHVATNAKEPYRVSKIGDNVVSLHEHCYGMSMVSPDVERLPPIHTFRGHPGTAYFRVSGDEQTTHLLSARTMTERGLWCQKQGIGRICLDFWNVLKNPKGRGNINIYNRYPHSSCAQREPSLKRMTWPGPQGAETTPRFEAFAEGLQESEAMIVISEAAESHEGKQLAERCRKLLRDRLMFCHSRNYTRWLHVYYHVNHGGWQDLARRTFELAGEVTKKLGR